jgi:hypothetical protein
MKTFADLVELADSGETEGRIANRGGVWRQQPVQNAPEKIVFTSRGTTWCYDVQELRTDPRLREAIRRTSAMRAGAQGI